jgi:hypothetical protein
MKEVFKILKDTRNSCGYGRSAGSLWEVSNLGRIRKNGALIGGYQGKNGYVYVCRKCLLHRAVATLFIDNPDNKPQIDHIDGNKQNNRVDNLRWVTQSENLLNPNTNAARHKPLTEEHKLNISKGRKGVKHSTETKKKMSNYHFGLKMMNDGTKNYWVEPNDIQKKLQQGFVFGKLLRPKN